MEVVIHEKGVEATAKMVREALEDVLGFGRDGLKPFKRQIGVMIDACEEVQAAKRTRQ